MRNALLLLLTLIITSGASASVTTPESGDGFVPVTCDRAIASSPLMASRITCHVLSVPLDHSNPSNPARIRLAVYRIAARLPQSRIGTLLVQPDGFSQNPLASLTKVAEQRFQRPGPSEPESLLTLADHFDLVTLQPRGTGDTQLRCTQMSAGAASRYLLDPSDDAAWHQWVAEARAFAMSCGPNAAFLGTTQAVNDIDALRTMLGEPSLYFYAQGRGAWITTWYAAAHPDTTARMLLDGAISFHLRRFPWQTNVHQVYRERMLRESLVRPAIDLATGDVPEQTTTSIMQRLQHMPLVLRRAWHARLNQPTDIMAALAVADRWPLLLSGERIREMNRHRFHPDPALNARIRHAAGDLLEAIPTDHTAWDRQGIDGATLATLCNDSPHQTDVDALRADESFHRDVFSLPDTDAIVHGVACHAWPFGSSNRPLPQTSSKAPSIMMIHAGVDHMAPPGGVEGVAHDYPNAYLVVESSLAARPVFGHPASQCATRMALDYLMTGRLPATHITRC